jgi:hypothetical protein
MREKKFHLIFISIILCLFIVFAGCSNTNPGENSSKSSKELTKTLRPNLNAHISDENLGIILTGFEYIKERPTEVPFSMNPSQESSEFFYADVKNHSAVGGFVTQLSDNETYFTVNVTFTNPENKTLTDFSPGSFPQMPVVIIDNSTNYTAVAWKIYNIPYNPSKFKKSELETSFAPGTSMKIIFELPTEIMPTKLSIPYRKDTPYWREYEYGNLIIDLYTRNS